MSKKRISCLAMCMIVAMLVHGLLVGKGKSKKKLRDLGYSDISDVQDRQDDLIHFIDGQHINRFKPVSMISDDEVELYLKYIRRGGLKSNIVKSNRSRKVRNGSQLMKQISYEHLVYIIRSLMDHDEQKIQKVRLIYSSDDYSENKIKFPNFFSKIEQKKKEKQHIFFSHPLIKKLIKNEKSVRRTVIESLLGGLLNRNPRVRLVAVHLLRRLVPEPTTWDFINDRIKELPYGRIRKSGVSLDAIEETVQKIPYYYVKINEQLAYEIIFKELLNLRRFISRFVLVNKITKGSPKLLVNLDPILFRLLSQSIDQEGLSKLPIYYFSSQKQIVALIYGLNNPDESIREKCAYALLFALKRDDVRLDIKLQIFKALYESSWNGLVVKSDASQSDIDKKQMKELLQAFLDQNPTYQNFNTWPLDKYDLKDETYILYADAVLKSNPVDLDQIVLQKTQVINKSNEPQVDKDSFVANDKAFIQEHYVFERE